MPNDVPANAYTTSWIDRDSERSTSRVNIKQQIDNAAFIAAEALYVSAIDAVTNGNIWQSSAQLNTLASQLPPTGNAFRENKWLVRYEDTVTFERFTFTLPTADPTTVTLIPGTDKVDLTVGNGLNLKNDGEAFLMSPRGNAVNIYEVEYVGRNI